MKLNLEQPGIHALKIKVLVFPSFFDPTLFEKHTAPIVKAKREKLVCFQFVHFTISRGWGIFNLFVYLEPIILDEVPPLGWTGEEGDLSLVSNYPTWSWSITE